MKTFRNALQGIFFALVFASTFASASPAREDDANDVRSDARVISARAGRVNLVSGNVQLRRADSLEWRVLTPDDELKSGDTVTTGVGGRVEILLNPGSYFRAGANTEFTLASADLDDLRVELARGSAVVEATGYTETELAITVATPRASVHIIRTGIYRINALADGTAEVGVFEGRAVINGTLVKGGKRARAGAAGVEVTKLDKKNRDELDLWSRDRGKELAKANEKLQRRALRSFFERNRLDDIFGRYDNLSGIWFYSPYSRCYTFVPFGGYSRSPYGHWYGTGIIPYPSWRWPGTTPPNGWTPPSGGGTAGGGVTPGGGGSTGGGGTTAGGTPPPQGPPPPSTPPSSGGAGRTTPSLGDMPDRVPTTPRMEKNPSDGQPRRDNR
jgi:hypothetical protein